MTERKRQGARNKTRSRDDITQVVPAYQPTPQERAVAKTYFAKREQPATCPGLKVSGKSVTVDHPDGKVGWLLLTQALGAADYAFAGILVSQLASTVLSEQPDSMKTDALNSMLAAVKSIEPKNEIEAMLAAQMAAIHNATMQMASRLATVKGLHQAEAAERGLNKLARTFTLQLEALKRLRSGGEQKVRVEHVHVGWSGDCWSHRTGRENQIDRSATAKPMMVNPQRSRADVRTCTMSGRHGLKGRLRLMTQSGLLLTQRDL